MFTPRIGTALGKWVAERKDIPRRTEWKDHEGNVITNDWIQQGVPDPARQQAFNILEDCRAEYYLALKYPSVRPFLVALIGDYLIEHPEQLGESWYLLAGRKYFSVSARRASAREYASKYGEEQAKQVYAICSEYRSLVFPRQYTRAQELIEQLMELLPADLNTPNGCVNRPVMRNGKPASEKEQDNLLAQDQEQDKMQGGEGYTPSGEDETGVVNDETAQFNTDKDQELLEAVEQVVNRAKADQSLKRKVAETSKAIAKDGSTRSILIKSAGKGYEPSQSEITAGRLFGQELERIRIDSDPAWELEKPTGKLNVRRAMNADVNEIGRLFDRWTIGNDDHEIEACILIDRSGSMYSEIGSACRSAWVIKRGIEKINGRVSVMTFGSDSRLLYSPDDKASATEVKLVEASGGTDPRYALMESERIMAQSKAKTKLLFLLTDGGFSTDNDQIIERLKQDSVYASVVFLGSEGYIQTIMGNPEERKAYAHGADNFRAIAKPIDLIKVAKDVVRHQLKASH
jgi:hypothetical protein